LKKSACGVFARHSRLTISAAFEQPAGSREMI
jgi:hypothetical protein